MEFKQYKAGDKFKIISPVKNNNNLEVGQIVSLIMEGSALFTVKCSDDKLHYVYKECIELYDALVHTSITDEVEALSQTIMEFHKENYIDKCLDERRLEDIKGVLQSDQNLN